MQLVVQYALHVVEHHPAPAGRCLPAGVNDRCAGEEPRLFINAVGWPLAALATVVEGTPAWQVGALERTQGDGRGLEVEQVAAQDGS
jgi:hypothetical protein